MNKATFYLSAMAALLAVSCSGSKCHTDSVQSPDQLVNPFIGTDFTGNTYPGAQAPFGMVQLSPDNGLPGWDRIAGLLTGYMKTPLSTQKAPAISD